jgi:hypothetical protein
MEMDVIAMGIAISVQGYSVKERRGPVNIFICIYIIYSTNTGQVDIYDYYSLYAYI